MWVKPGAESGVRQVVQSSAVLTREPGGRESGPFCAGGTELGLLTSRPHTVTLSCPLSELLTGRPATALFIARSDTVLVNQQPVRLALGISLKLINWPGELWWGVISKFCVLCARLSRICFADSDSNYLRLAFLTAETSQKPQTIHVSH